MEQHQDVIQKIEAYLSKKCPERKDLKVVDLEKSAGGLSYETYLFRITWNGPKGPDTEDLVIRMEPEKGHVPPYDIRPEYDVLKRLYGAGIPTPKVFFLEEDSSVLGHRFYVMERLEGKNLWNFYPDDPGQREGLETEYVTILVRLHALDWQSLGLSPRGVHESGFPSAEKEITRWEQVINENQFWQRPGLAKMGVWLKKNIPRPARTTLCHGDYGPQNLLIRDGRIVALLDWEMAKIGDPISDLGWSCLMNKVLKGIWDETSLVRKYKQISGVDVDDGSLHYWRIFANFKLSAICVTAIKAGIGFKDPNIRMTYLCMKTLSVLQNEASEMLETFI